jgi:hypothetical protein
MSLSSSDLSVSVVVSANKALPSEHDLFEALLDFGLPLVAVIWVVRIPFGPWHGHVMYENVTRTRVENPPCDVLLAQHQER